MYNDMKTLVVRNDAGVLRVGVSNPPVNVMSLQTAADLTAVAKLAWTDDAVKVIVLESVDPDFFIAHFDAAVVVAAPDDPNPVHSPDLNFLHTMCANFRENPKSLTHKGGIDFSFGRAFGSSGGCGR